MNQTKYTNLANIYLFKVNNKNTKKCEICSKYTIKTPELRPRRRFGIFKAYFTSFSSLSIVDFEQVNVS